MRAKAILGNILGLLLIFNIAYAQLKKAPPSQIPQAIIQACVFEKSISTQDEITIYVMGSEKIADVLKMYVGQKLGNSTLTEVKVGQKAPSDKPTMLFLGDPELLNRATAYCQENGVLSITNMPSMVQAGVSLGIGIDEAGSLKLLLNPKAADKERTNWNLAIMKLAIIVD